MGAFSLDYRVTEGPTLPELCMAMIAKGMAVKFQALEEEPILLQYPLAGIQDDLFCIWMPLRVLQQVPEETCEGVVHVPEGFCNCTGGLQIVGDNNNLIIEEISFDQPCFQTEYIPYISASAICQTNRSMHARRIVCLDKSSAVVRRT